MGHPYTAYPWTLDGVGLCAVLRDPQLLASAYKQAPQPFREVVIELAPPPNRLAPAALLRRAFRSQADKAHYLGHSLVKILADPPRRRKLLERTTRMVRNRRQAHRLLAERLFFHVTGEHESRLPTLNEVCVMRERGFHYLQAEKFRSWLADAEVTAERQRPLALFACAFAILQPEEATGLLQVLLDRDPAFDFWLAPEPARAAPMTAKPSSPPAPVIPTPAPVMVKVALPPAEPAQQSPFDIRVSPARLTELLDLLRSWKGAYAPVGDNWLRAARPSGDAGAPTAAWGEYLPADLLATQRDIEQAERDLQKVLREWDQKIHHLREQVQRVIGECEEALAAYRAVEKRVREQFALLVAMPWLPCPPPAERLLARLSELPPPQALEGLVSLEQQLARLLRSHEMLSGLTQQLKRPAGPLVPAGVTDLDEAATLLEQQAERWRQELHQVGQREHSVATLLTLLQEAERERFQRLLEETEAMRWVEVLQFLSGGPPRTPDGERFAVLVGRDELIAAVFALLWHKDAAQAVGAAAALAGVEDGTLFRRLAFLDSAQIQALAEALPALAPRLTEGLVLAALRAGQPGRLEYAEPMLHGEVLPSGVAAFYRRLLEAGRRGRLHNPLARLRPLLGQAAPDVSRRLEAASHRKKLLEAIDNPPGRSSNYHHLRAHARTLFLVPLRDAVARDDAEDAWRRWRQDAADQKVEACVQVSGLGREVDNTYRLQTRRYLDHFEAELELWLELGRRVDADPNPLMPALEALRQERAGGTLRRRLERLCGGVEDPDLPPADFGQRCAVNDAGVPVLLDPAGLIDAPMTDSWPAAVRDGVVPLALLLGDLFRRALGREPATTADAVNIYLERGEFEAARRAAEDDTELAALVERIADRCRCEFRDEHRDLLEAARRARDLDDEVRDCLAVLETCLVELNFADARGWLEELAGLVQRFGARQDPERKALLELLSEGGIATDPDTPLDDLRRRMAELRQREAPRRQHLAPLRQLGEIASLPAVIAEKCQLLAQRLDRPALWPQNEEDAIQLELALEAMRDFAVRRLRWADLEGIRPLVERLIEWAAERVEVGLASAGSAEALVPLVRLAEEIGENCPDAHILQVLGKPAVSAEVKQPGEERPSESASEALREESTETGTTEATAERRVDALASYDPGEVLAELRAALAPHLVAEPPAPEAEECLLREASMRFHWQETRRRAAALIRAHPGPLPAERALDVEAVYAVALACSAGDASSTAALFCNACLAVLLVPDRSQCQHYLSADFLDDLPPRAVLALEGKPREELLPLGGRALGERLAVTLARLKELAPSDETFRRLTDFCWKAGAQLPVHLWENLKGMPANEKPRSDLLILLYRLRLLPALERLSEQARPLDDLIRDCLRAAVQAETDPTLRTVAHEIRVALRQQAYRRPNSQPWLLLFSWIEKQNSRPQGEALECDLLSEYLSRAGAATDLQVRLLPSSTDPPRDLHIEISVAGGASFRHPLLSEDPLWKERVVSLPVPPAALQEAGDEVEIAYRLTGRTVFQTPIDLRRSWRVPVLSRNAEPIDEEAILAAWPGVSGNPVLAERGFHGRREEYDEIERYLRDPYRQKSVMLIGQRRIGKTSLLLKMVQSLPPRDGGVCGVFFDVKGLPLPPGQMNKSFFEGLLSALKELPENRPLLEALHGADLSALVRSLQPEVSLASALEGLVNRLATASRGRVRRLALFIDEFDRFVEPMLQGGAAEVENLQWNLRQIVQRSPSLSLILAGSGQQRQFTDEYGKPFYGSIEKVFLRPFALEAEREAIADTFLPRSLRARLCSADRLAEVLDEAYRLTGGHPWYLAMLGCGAARVSRGHRLTPALLRRAAELMLQGQIPRGGKINDRVSFYGHDFESLKPLPPRLQAAAQIQLAYTAQRTSTEFAWLPRWQVLDHPRLVQLTSEEERQRALKALLDETVLELDAGRSLVRVRVPLTAEAVRLNALDILDAAIRQLRPTDRRIAS